jgi:hypothetical protein
MTKTIPVLLFSLSLAADVATGFAAPLPIKIAKCEWTIFKADDGGSQGHIKLVVICGADQPKEGDNPMQWDWSCLIRPLGEGDLDVYDLVKAVEKSGYKGPYGLICWGLKQPPREHLTKSIAT